jgi:hypothetical protein
LALLLIPTFVLPQPFRLLFSPMRALLCSQPTFLSPPGLETGLRSPVLAARFWRTLTILLSFILHSRTSVMNTLGRSFRTSPITLVGAHYLPLTAPTSTTPLPTFSR